MRLAIITSDYGAAANVGGTVETRVRTFDLPPEIIEYIKSQRGNYSHVSFGVDDSPRPTKAEPR